MLDEIAYSQQPDRMIMMMDDDYGIDLMRDLAEYATQQAKDTIPKISGTLAGSVRPVYGVNYWGIFFPNRRLWFLEQGTNPFTMNSLAGKVIPMWVDDPTGEEAREIGRKAKTRITVDGRRQTLIFRKAAKKGARKTVIRKGVKKSVPRSYPGAPGRISNRLNSGRIGTPNGGVRWRHPGIGPRHYLNNSMETTCLAFGVKPEVVKLVDSATFSTATRS